jgi:mRNA interferase MazF
LKRGEIWRVAGGSGYAGKPRPAVIIQDDRFSATNSVTVCLFTTNPTEAPLARLLIQPSQTNGLRAPCRIMADKISTVPRAAIGKRIGRLSDEDMVRLNRVVLVFFGMAVGSNQGSSSEG